MSEMLATLVVMGVLTIGGVVGIKYAMEVHKENESIDWVVKTIVGSRTGFLLEQYGEKAEAGKVQQVPIAEVISGVPLNAVPEGQISYSYTTPLGAEVSVDVINKNAFEVDMTNVSYGVCTKLLNGPLEYQCAYKKDDRSAGEVLPGASKEDKDAFCEKIDPKKRTPFNPEGDESDVSPWDLTVCFSSDPKYCGVTPVPAKCGDPNDGCDSCPTGTYCDGAILGSCVGECKPLPPVPAKCGDPNDECDSCPTGTYCDGATQGSCNGTCEPLPPVPDKCGDLDECDECPEGTYCVGATQGSCNGDCKPLPKCGDVAADCELCPTGTVCLDKTDQSCGSQCCPEERFCDSVCCPEGQKCDPDTKTCVRRCGDPNYGCWECPQGTYCVGATLGMCNGDCEPLPKCGDVAADCEVCPTGTVCLDSNDQTCGSQCCPEERRCGSECCPEGQKCDPDTNACMTRCGDSDECQACGEWEMCVGATLGMCDGICEPQQMCGDEAADCKPCPTGTVCLDKTDQSCGSQCCPEKRVCDSVCCSEGQECDPVSKTCVRRCGDSDECQACEEWEMCDGATQGSCDGECKPLSCGDGCDECPDGTSCVGASSDKCDGECTPLSVPPPSDDFFGPTGSPVGWPGCDADPNTWGYCTSTTGCPDGICTSDCYCKPNEEGGYTSLCRSKERPYGIYCPKGYPYPKWGKCYENSDVGNILTKSTFGICCPFERHCATNSIVTCCTEGDYTDPDGFYCSGVACMYCPSTIDRLNGDSGRMEDARFIGCCNRLNGKTYNDQCCTVDMAWQTPSCCKAFKYTWVNEGEGGYEGCCLDGAQTNEACCKALGSGVWENGSCLCKENEELVENENTSMCCPTVSIGVKPVLRKPWPSDL